MRAAPEPLRFENTLIEDAKAKAEKDDENSNNGKSEDFWSGTACVGRSVLGGSGRA